MLTLDYSLLNFLLRLIFLCKLNLRAYHLDVRVIVKSTINPQSANIVQMPLLFSFHNQVQIYKYLNTLKLKYSVGLNVYRSKDPKFSIKEPVKALKVSGLRVESVSSFYYIVKKNS